ncbi:PadR family transcriptional regulator [Niallia circulans]|jgi:PadR family transcriptional regulator, regulatory protein PadR|nr:PadR family transcriptional regulator [Niallia circulans]
MVKYNYYDRHSMIDEVFGRGDFLISSDVIRGYNDTIILFLLLEKDSYGYEISKDIRTLTNEKYIIKETTLYSAFNRLIKNNYIHSYYKEGEFGKRRTYYTITSEGRKYYQEKCQEWFVTQEVINLFIKEGYNE